MERFQALAAALPPHADGFLITSESNIFYFTGFPCDAALLLATRAGCWFFTDSRYLEAAQRVIRGVTFCDTARFAAEFPAVCEANGVRKLLVETAAMTVREAQKYAALLPQTELLYEDDLAFLSAFRRQKSDAEAQKIERAQRIAEAALEQILPMVRPGKTEKEIALELDYTMLRMGADALSFQTIVVSGENSSLPHGVPGSRQLRDGDFVTMDFGAVVDGYHSDMTRTFALGSCTPEMREVYETVLRAQTAALAVMHPGTLCKDADAAARDVITAAGFGDYFGHGTGHGVGVQIHERPNVSPRSSETLQLGDVVTAEPGIYLPGRFGVRIEDMVRITEDGHYNFTKADKALRVLPIR
ncbi:MAG: aminopeptidase P family protein [Clostridia bacterium]|nr:aminopeptidase P family protein [Clostridia bacterium]